MKLIELPNGSWVDPFTITAINVRRKDNHTSRPYVNVIGPGDTSNTIYCNDEECVDVARLIAKQVNDACNKSITEKDKEYLKKVKEIEEDKKLYLALLPPQDAFLYAIKEYADLDDAFLLKSLNEIDELDIKFQGAYIWGIEDEQVVIHVNDKYLTTIYSAGPKYAKAIYETANKLVNK